MTSSPSPTPFSLRIAFNCDTWKPQEIHIQEALSHLTPVEQKRVKSFVYQRDLKHALIGRLLILYACKKFFGFVPQDPAKPNPHPFNYYFGRTPQSRPIIVYTSNNRQLTGTVTDPISQLKDFDFNVSHHGSWVVCACEENAAVGCDITRFETNVDGTESVTDFFNSFQQCFTKYEWSVINLETEDSPKFESAKDRDRVRLQNFHRHWGLKESYIKAVGIGLGMDLQSCQFTLSEPLGITTPASHQKEYPKIVAHTTEIEVRGQKQGSYRFEEVLLDSEHFIATCIGPVSGAIHDMRKTFPSQKRVERNLNERQNEPVRPYEPSRANFEVLDYLTLRRGIV